MTDTTANTSACNNTRNEILEIAKLVYSEYQYRHETIWKLTNMSVLAIVTLMVVPYVLVKEGVFIGLRYAFPLVSIMLCVISFLLVNAEYARLRATRKRYNNLLGLLCRKVGEEPLAAHHKADDISSCVICGEIKMKNLDPKHPLLGMAMIPIVEIIFWLYTALAILSGFEIYLFATNLI